MRRREMPIRYHVASAGTPAGKGTGMKKSIRKRLLVGFAITVSVCMVVVSAVIVLLAGTSLYGATVHESNYFLIGAANEIDGKLSAYRAVLDTFSADLEQLAEQELRDRAAVAAMLGRLLARHPDFSDIYFAFADGPAVFASGWTPQAGYDAFSEEWYQKAVEAAGDVVFSSPFVEPKEQKLAVAAARAHVQNGRVVGVAAVEIPMDAIFAMVDGMELAAGSYGFLVSRTGEVLHHPHESYAASGAGFARLDGSLAALLSAQSGQADFEPVVAKGPDGKTCFHFAQGFENVDWVIAAAVPVIEVWGAVLNMLMVTVILTIVAIFAARMIYSQVIRIRIGDPVKALVEVADSMARGRIDCEVKVDRADEIGRLQRSFSSMRATVAGQVECLKRIAEGDLTVQANPLSEQDAMGMALATLLARNSQMLGGIRSAAQNVASGAQQIADGASALAAGSTEQAATVEEFGATIASLKEQADESANTAEETRRGSEKMGALMQKGLDAMEQMNRAMDDIDRSSQQIAGIIQIIDDIAFKTGILALNAAIEAARAGQHGRGFAVVADEVRSLAAQSAEAAQRTAELIGRSVDSVQTGSRVLKATSDSLRQLGSIAGGNIAKMQRLSELAKLQDQLIAELNAGIGQISGVVQTNAATAEENAAAAQEMSAQSAHLAHIVARYRIREDAMA